MTDSTTQGYQELEEHNKLMEKLDEVVKAAYELFNLYDPNVITTHNESSTAHPDIRESVSKVQVSVTNLKKTFDASIDEVKSDYTDKISKVENTINTLVGEDGGVSFAKKAQYNNSGYELTDTIVKDIAYNTSTNTISYTRINDKKGSFAINKVSSTVSGLMTPDDKSKLDSAASDISALQVNITQIASNQTAVTDDEVDDMAVAAWSPDSTVNNNLTWNDSSYSPFTNHYNLDGIQETSW